MHKVNPVRFGSLLVVAVLLAATLFGWAPVAASASPSHFLVTRDGDSYRAASSAQVYAGSLKTVIESVVADLNSSGGGTVSFSAGDFDLGADWFKFNEVLTDITFEGQGMDVTILRNYTTVDADSEPFNFRGTDRVVIRDLTVSAGGTPRNTSDAIDFDRGNNSVVERVKITASRSKGIIFDGKNVDRDGTPWQSGGNIVRDCVIQGTNNDGIQFLASSNNRVEGCTITNVTQDGIDVRKSEATAQQPNKKSNGNVLVNNVIERAGQNGIRVTSSDGTLITGNTITNSSLDGIRIESLNSITCDDNTVDANTATDNQATKTQSYGLNISSSLCNRTVVGSNGFAGNKTGEIRDLGTNTQYGNADTTPPAVPDNLTALAVGSRSIDLSWTASTDDVGVTGYELMRDGVPLASTGTTTAYVDSSVAPASTYAYQVRAVDAAGNRSELSDPVSATTAEASVLVFSATDDTHVRADQPGTNFGSAPELGVDGSPTKDILLKFAVTGITGPITSARIRLYCIDSSNSGGSFSRVQSHAWGEGSVTWSTAPAADANPFATLGSVSAGNWYEIDVTPLLSGDGTYSFRVSSSSSNGADYTSKEGASGFRPELVIDTDAAPSEPDTDPPSAPSALSAAAGSPNQVDLSWTAATDNVGVAGYEILRDGSVATTLGPVTSYRDTTVSAATEYLYQVRAFDAAGNRSAGSNTATTTTPAPASNTCQDSAPTSGAYTVTVCMTAPYAGASLSGNRQVSAEVTVTGTSPGVQKVIFWLGSEYVLTDYQAPYTFTLESGRWPDGQRTLGVQPHMRDGFVAQAANISTTFANDITEPPTNNRQFTPTTGTSPAPGQPFVFAAVGDGADGATNAGRVSDLLASWDPNMVTYLGDVYDRGTPTEFANWYGVDGLFGRVRSVTNPVFGNHENLTPGSAGYFDYWDNVPNFYSVDAAGWHLLFIDSTGAFGQTSPSSEQYQWIAADLASNESACTMAMFHHPTWTVGPTHESGDPTRLRPIWSLLANNGVDVVLTGHDHNYQRWRSMDADGALSSTGTTQFVVGTGGHGIQQFIRTDSRLAVGFDTSPAAFGALRVELNEAGAAYQFADTNGTVLDSGSIQCSGTPTDTTPPSSPTNLTATATSSVAVDLSWIGSTDNLGVTAYDIYRDGDLLSATGAGTNYVDRTTSGGVTYTYEVRARDAAGNASARSAPATVTTPTLLFSDDFETGDLSRWTAVNGLIVQSQEKLSGSYAARGTTTSAATWAWRSLANAESELYYRTRFKLIDAPLSTVYLGKVRTSGGGSIAGVYVSATGRLGVRNDVSAGSTTSTTSVSVGAWHDLQLRVMTGTSGAIEVWLDGARIDELALTTNLGTAPIGRIQLGDNAGGSFDVALDDVELDTQFITDGAPPPDTTAPSAPTGLAASATSSNRVNLSWTASTDDVGVSGYDIYRNNNLLTSFGAETTYSDLAVAADTSYSYQVRARDAAGNVSAPSNTADATTPAPPTSGTFTFNAAADSYVDAAVPTTNFGSGTALRFDASPQQVVYLHFNLSGMVGAVDRVTLHLYALTNHPKGCTVHPVADTSWSEGGLTWDNAPARGAGVATCGALSANTWHEVDLTSAALVSGDGTLSLAISNPSSTSSRFSSRETAFVPQLVVQTVESAP